MARQVNEGVRIKRSKADCLMNSKSKSGSNEGDPAGARRGRAEREGG